MHALHGWLPNFCSTQDLPLLAGKRVSMSSHGAGLAATLHSVKVTQDATPGPALEKIIASLCALKSRLDSRTIC